MEARLTQRGGVRALFAGSGGAGAWWGPRTSPAVLMLGPPGRGGLGPAEHMRRSLPRSRNSSRHLERCRWLKYSQGSKLLGRRRERDSPRCVDIMRQCGPLRISAGLGRQSSSCTSALPRLRLKWPCSPICPPGVCASSSREHGCSLVRCLWLAWRCFVLWLRVGEVSGLPMGDVSLPLWLRFWNSKTGEEGCQSRPTSPWADQHREALLRWAQAKGLRPTDHLFPWGSASREHKFLEVLGSTPWRHCR